MGATVIDRVTSEMNLYRDESFGPITAIIRARDEEEAIRLAPAAGGPVGGGVHHDAARGLGPRGGSASATSTDRPSPTSAMPFGGVGASGYGRLAARPVSTASPKPV